MNVNEMPKTGYPLSWPERWARTNPNSRRWSNFKATLARGCEEIEREISRLGGRGLIISSNIQPRLDGRPYSNQAAPKDPGVAVYFSLKQRPTVLACDKWLGPEENLWAIVKHVEAMRGQARWGVGSIEQAFAGYTALPERAGGISWWEVLGVSISATEEQINEAYRLKAKKCHPDTGGSHDAMAALNEAYRMATNQRQAA